MRDPMDSLENDVDISKLGETPDATDPSPVGEPVAEPPVDKGPETPVTTGDSQGSPSVPTDPPAGADTDNHEEVFDDDETSDTTDPVLADALKTEPEAQSDPEVVVEQDTAVAGDTVPEDTVRCNYNGRTYLFPDIIKFQMGNEHITQTRPYILNRPIKIGEEMITLSNLPPAAIHQLVSDYADKEDDPGTEEERYFHQLGLRAIANMPADNTLLRALNRKGSNYRQGYDTGDSLLLVSTIRPNPNKQVVSGDDARYQVLDAFNITGRIESFLPASGFWIRMERPSDSELNATYEMVMDDTISHAYRTYGRSYANQRSLLIGHLMELAFSHVKLVNTDLNGRSIRDFLYEEVSSEDHDYVIWMLMSLIWPDGWVYSRQIAGDEAQPFQVAQQVLNLRTLMHIDDAELSEDQLRYIADTRRKPSTSDQRTRYLEGFKRRRVTYMDPETFGIKTTRPIRMVIKAPSTAEVIASGESWLRNIVRMWDDSTAAQGGRDREQFIRREMNATRMRVYEHWVRSIEFLTDDKEVERSIEGREDIAKILNDLSSSPEIYAALQERVADHIADNSLYAVGVPMIEKRFGEETIPGNPFVMPLDLVNAFFSMLSTRVADS